LHRWRTGLHALHSVATWCVAVEQAVFHRGPHAPVVCQEMLEMRLASSHSAVRAWCRWHTAHRRQTASGSRSIFCCTWYGCHPGGLAPGGFTAARRASFSLETEAIAPVCARRFARTHTRV
jgi:hypothetical protein